MVLLSSSTTLPISQLNESNNPNSPPAPPLPSPPQPPPRQPLSSFISVKLDNCTTSPLSASQATWFELIFAISFAAAIGHICVPYERVEGVLVPTFFNSNPTIFHAFVIFDAFAFTAAVIGILLRGIHERINDYLSIFATTTLMAALSIHTSVLLPSFLKYIPCMLLLTILPILLSLRIRNGHQKYIQ